MFYICQRLHKTVLLNKLLNDTKGFLNERAHLNIQYWCWQ